MPFVDILISMHMRMFSVAGCRMLVGMGMCQMIVAVLI